MFSMISFKFFKVSSDNENRSESLAEEPRIRQPTPITPSRMPITKSSRTGPSPSTGSRQSDLSPRRGPAQRRLDFSSSPTPAVQSPASRPPESSLPRTSPSPGPSSPAELSSPPARELNDSRRSSRSRRSLNLIEDFSGFYKIDTSKLQFKD